MTAEVINAKQGLTRIPTYAELFNKIDREKIKTYDIRKILDRKSPGSSTEHKQHPPSRLTTNKLQKDGTRLKPIFLTTLV
jgi:hypothetical protein